MDNDITTQNSQPQNSFEIFSYESYKDQHEAIKPATPIEEIMHALKHHRVTKSEYEQIYEEIKNLDPNEPILWMGKPSQAIHLGIYVVCLLFGFLVFPLIIAYFVYQQTKHTIYVITSERLRVYSGIISKRNDDIELYRIKDTIFFQPVTLRLFGLSNIRIIASDPTWGDFVIAGVTNGRVLREKIRNTVEFAREKKGVREVDYYTRGGPMPPQL